MIEAVHMKPCLTHAAYGSHTKYIRAGTKATDNVVFDKTGDNVVDGKMPDDA
jgi:hypothetical protein